MSARYDARVLNGLVEALLDAADAHDADPDAPGADPHRDAAAALQAEIARIGGRPDDDGSLLARAGAALGRAPDLERVETGLKARFDTVLDDDRLAGELRDAVLRAWDTVKPVHDAVLEAAERDAAS